MVEENVVMVLFQQIKFYRWRIKIRTIIAGSRTITDGNLIKKAVESSGFSITEVISGGATGVDKLGENYAHKAGIDLITIHANWVKHDRAAGPIRNMKMAVYATSDRSKKAGLIAIWDGKSRGTKNIIDTATRLGLKVFIYRVDLNKSQY